MVSKNSEMGYKKKISRVQPENRQVEKAGITTRRIIEVGESMMICF